MVADSELLQHTSARATQMYVSTVSLNSGTPVGRRCYDNSIRGISYSVYSRIEACGVEWVAVVAVLLSHGSEGERQENKNRHSGALELSNTTHIHSHAVSTIVAGTMLSDPRARRAVRVCHSCAVAALLTSTVVCDSHTAHTPFLSVVSHIQID